ncbi:hypothetical protein C1889_27140 [Pseudomonas sp. FW507-12TSA]|nr:hypothetical protein C1889_27140 [Pseudomonas sp. FW507-12TSA]
MTLVIRVLMTMIGLFLPCDGYKGAGQPRPGTGHDPCTTRLDSQVAVVVDQLIDCFVDVAQRRRSANGRR